MSPTAFSERLTQLLDDFSFTVAVMHDCAKETGELNIPASMNLRDALTHVHAALDFLDHEYCEETGCEACRGLDNQMAYTREHIRRAAVEAVQELFERRYGEAERNYRDLISRYAHYNTPLGSEDIRARLEAMRRALKEFRLGKNGMNWQHLTDDFLLVCREDLPEINRTIIGRYSQFKTA